MRIQHNIMAMNSYRNFSNNTKAVGKNLEKLSSGYRINNAGDDAAGLAVSEKMRAQITGLKTAQKNAKDGISLVKTAEGALTEVHSMLNRMVDLAGQSANGTYDNEVDRANLQKEVDALKEEVNRIADSSNFNGIKLLDGTQAAKGAAAAGVPSVKGLTLTDTAATAKTSVVNGVYELSTAAATSASKFEFSFTDNSGKKTTINFSFDDSGTGELIAADGTRYAGTKAAITEAQWGSALSAELNKTSMAEKFTITAAGGNVSFVSKDTGSGAAEVVVGKGVDDTHAATANLAGAITGGADAFQSADITADKEFSVGGKKFMIATAADKAAAAGKGVNVVINAGGVDATSLGEMASIIEKETGYKPTVNAGNTGFDFKANASANASAGKGGLTLQIGDTAESFNQMKVSIGDMHAKALGIDGVDISTQEGGAAAMESIKNAINTVSSTRGDLGALQNRLDHTINNLSVMHENIQDAEATIRDTDVADEMMAYTKNNILVQSAQAMLAQANQVPQGVLQLLG